MENIKAFRFIGTVLPNGIAANDSKEIIISVCLDINTFCEEFLTDNAEDISTNYNNFYKALQNLKTFLSGMKEFNFHIEELAQSVPGEGAQNPFDHFCNEASQGKSPQDYEMIRNTLWAQIFPFYATRANMEKMEKTEKIVTPSSRTSNEKVKAIKMLFDEDDFADKLIDSFSLENGDHREKVQLILKHVKDVPVFKSTEIWKRIDSAAKVRENLAMTEKIEFIKRNPSNTRVDAKSEYERQFGRLMKSGVPDNSAPGPGERALDKQALVQQLQYERNAVTYYLDSPGIDIDEIINSFNALSNEPAIMRLMGLIRDYRVVLPSTLPETFTIRPMSLGEKMLGLPTKISVIKRSVNGLDKFAYVVCSNNSSETYFENSILKSDGAELIPCDLASKRSQLRDYAVKVSKGEDVAGGESKDALTRGILFTHKNLNKIIEPVRIADDAGNINCNFYTDEYVTRGHRVAVRIGKNKVHSLTSRSLSLRLKNDSLPFYFCGNAEGCIHFDAPAIFEQDGQLQAATSNVLFEYSGELLKLKSAFSKANLISKSDRAANEAQYHNDGGLYKSKARFEGPCVADGQSCPQTVSFRYFPFATKVYEGYLNCQYSIPQAFTIDNTPQLRFGSTYTFAVYQEYLNGWGMPLSAHPSPIQLTVQDLLREAPDKFFPKEITFRPLENKKSVLLYHCKEFHDDPSKPIADRASLDHLVIRSDNSDDSMPAPDDRHVLPHKIDIEPAFWHGLISPPLMSPQESFSVKRRANCSYLDNDHFIKSTTPPGINGKYHECPEECREYCGGTQMKNFYPQKHIYPRFLTDPTVKGFSVSLFWDEGCTIPVEINNTNPAQFGGTAGLKPKSYGLQLKGAKSKSYILNASEKELFQIHLKKGTIVFAKLTNELAAEGKSYLLNGWWSYLQKTSFNNSVKLRNANSGTDISGWENKVIADRNTAKTIRLTHAVKLPLVMPRILQLCSTPLDRRMIEHVDRWLKEEPHHYTLESNVIAHRIDKDSQTPTINSELARVELTAHFERLDAISKIEFLKDITPTGSLQIWMRKQEYVDNAKQAVLQQKSKTNHIPTEPVYKFEDQENVFSLEHEIKFSNDILQQLKDLTNARDLVEIDDAFRGIISKVNLTVNLNSKKFEEREYYLKSTSKFKGFFSDAALSGAGTGGNSLEQFSLPKTRDIAEVKFKVLVLNNTPPLKPSVAFAITTIQERRNYPEKRKTTSTQQGNIVTIYFKRDRLSSGKNERIGVVVDSKSNYNSLFKANNMISKVGRDMLSDGYANRSEFLQYDDITAPAVNEYHAAFDEELGIYHFLPKFDIAKQLWKIEVELSIKTVDGQFLHNPFVNFSFIHFQPFSLNYLTGQTPISLNELKTDCRISEVDNSSWCYLLPKRKLSVFFDQPNGLFDNEGEIDLTVGFDYESLHHFKTQREIDSQLTDVWLVRSNFIVTVQGCDEHNNWHSIGSWMETGSTLKKAQFHHALLSDQTIQKHENLARIKLSFKRNEDPEDEYSARYSHFRVRVIEVEWFTDELWKSEFLNSDLVDNEDFRVRYVELIY